MLTEFHKFVFHLFGTEIERGMRKTNATQTKNVKNKFTSVLAVLVGLHIMAEGNSFSMTMDLFHFPYIFFFSFEKYVFSIFFLLLFLFFKSMHFWLMFTYR